MPETLPSLVDQRVVALDLTGPRRLVTHLERAAGDLFADPAKATAVSADVQGTPGKIVSVRLFPYKDRHSVRVVFDLDPGSETYSELRLTLKVDNQPVSETWLYRWTA